MMSSPPQLQHPLGLSQYQNMLNESPVKPASYYFQNLDGDNSLNQSNHDGLNTFQDENNFKPTQLSLGSDDISQQFLYSNNDENPYYSMNQHHNNGSNGQNSDNFVVPVSQNDDSNSQFLQYPPKFEQNDGQQSSHQTSQNYQVQMQQQFQQHHPQHQGPHLHSFQHNPSNNHQNNQQQQQQVNLYPPMEFISNSQSSNSINEQLPQSTSTNTISSFDSMPLLTSSLVSSSISDNSIASPISFQNQSNQTPRRTTTNRRPSFSVTPLPSIYQTPAQSIGMNTTNATMTGGSITSPIAFGKNGVTPTTASRSQQRPRHRRTRSRLSLDANGAASIITINPSNSSNSILRSPANALNNNNNNGTNPFYTPPAFLSPHQGSPATTPLATPSIKKERSISNFESISPSMLMNPGSIDEAGEVGETGNDDTTKDETNNKDDDSMFIAAADLTMKLASKLASQSNNDTKFLCDPLNADFTLPTNQTNTSTTVKPTPTFTKPNISRSQSSINLHSIASNTSSTDQPHTTTNPNDPYQVKHYDILQPRKKIQKSNSTNNINDPSLLNGKKPKKVHSCPLCAAVFQRPEHVKRHMRSHSSEKPYECDEPGCGKRFNRGDNLKAHLRKIHHRQI